jgi:isochorismate hydrolase
MTRPLVAMTCVMIAVIAVTLLLRSFVTPADVMIHYSNNAVTYARQHHSVELDYSEESIDALETMIAAMRDQNQPDEKRALYARMWGGYFGEVIRRQHGGVWAQPASAGGDFLLLTKGMQLSPTTKVYQRLTDTNGENLTAFYDSLLHAWSR